MTQVRRTSRGAAAVMVSFSLAALFGASALTIDLGNAWQNERRLNTTSDAVALAAAGRYAAAQSGCGATAQQFLVANDPSAVLVECAPGGGAGTGSTSSGWVRVTTTKTVDYVFGPVIGIASGEVTSTTVARYGVPSRTSGLRPFALCVDTLHSLPAFNAWVASGANTASQPITVPYGKDDNPAACNDGFDVPGNWALLNFDGGANSESDLKEWVRNGYPGLVGTGSVPGNPGAFSQSLRSDLDTLVASGEEFPLPLFGRATSGGANAEFEVVAFANVKLVGHRTQGDSKQRSLTLVFLPGVVVGECCDDSGPYYGATVLQICSVQRDDLSGC